MIPRVAIIRAPGTNRDHDLARAFVCAGATIVPLPIGQLAHDASPLRTCQILAFPGGFSWGDDLGAGRILGLQIGSRLGDAVAEHLAGSGLVLGICNGFQGVMMSGLFDDDLPAPPLLGPNVDGAFVAGWTTLVASAHSNAAFVRAVAANQPQLDCPVAHGQGRFVATEMTLDALERAGRVAFRYAPAPAATGWLGNPNGSARAIAGITNAAGNVLGLMPHPENHIDPAQHPHRQRQTADGLALFRAMVAQVA